MTRRLLLGATALVLLGHPAATRGDDRPAALILQELKLVEVPDRPKAQEPGSTAAWVAKVRRTQAERAELILELDRAHPDHPESARLLPERWKILLNADRGAEAVAEADKAVARRPDDAALKVEAAYAKALHLAATKLRGRVKDVPPAQAAIDEFLRLAPGDERGAALLSLLVLAHTGDARTAVEDRILAGYPDSRQALGILASRRATEAIGKPFDLDFTDAITGNPVSVQSTLKGKVVVIDFWATWCGPCVAELPKMKDLYAEFAPRGVEFVGVSFDAPEDEGGRQALKDFVAKREIPWPQYYQGQGWDSPFSRSWGIDAIPAVFLIDADGKLVTKDARGRLEALIPELLKAGKAK